MIYAILVCMFPCLTCSDWSLHLALPNNSSAIQSSAEGSPRTSVAHVNQEPVQSDMSGVSLQLSIADMSAAAPFSDTVMLVASQETDTPGPPPRFVRGSLLYQALIPMIIPAP